MPQDTLQCMLQYEPFKQSPLPGYCLPEQWQQPEETGGKLRVLFLTGKKTAAVATQLILRNQSTDSLCAVGGHPNQTVAETSLSAGCGHQWLHSRMCSNSAPVSYSAPLCSSGAMRSPCRRQPLPAPLIRVLSLMAVHQSLAEHGCKRGLIPILGWQPLQEHDHVLEFHRHELRLPLLQERCADLCRPCNDRVTCQQGTQTSGKYDAARE